MFTGRRHGRHTDREHECHSGHPYLRAVFVIRAT